MTRPTARAQCETLLFQRLATARVLFVILAGFSGSQDFAMAASMPRVNGRLNLVVKWLNSKVEVVGSILLNWSQLDPCLETCIICPNHSQDIDRALSRLAISIALRRSRSYRAVCR